ncbi:uncharacterized protein LACBIDRAFT_307387 [Laccaria bicolor S238N-H82]|uniref:Predicted protein n=1 Tax=Laccaria bicolor (strain S238N-H82 / ATCC MYA-4686) TaxID=486041 RepID=B0DQ10_LACBS|nr:uncharacterized protein LACBIDRAFT_307387 [Laccaria bicolor S238N-H82]EDR03211.1 predicted protein [Laccaria bicolor S238N-H82]|eukprot:XP_001886007.1 predicted protein [Laccaria bicolor S238N-H82]
MIGIGKCPCFYIYYWKRGSGDLLSLSSTTCPSKPRPIPPIQRRVLVSPIGGAQCLGFNETLNGK